MKLIGCLVLLSIFGQLYGEPIRVCYYATWAVSREPHPVLPGDIDPNVCTHIIIAFARIESSGDSIAPDLQRDLALYQDVIALKQKNPHLKVMLAVGGWNEQGDGFIQAVSNETMMQAFTENAISFLRSHNMDGIDIDWEYPADRGSEAEDKHRYARWLQVMQEKFTAEASGNDKDKLLLSVAASAAVNRTYESYEVPAISRYADFISLMMYDFHGEWEETVNVHSALYSKTDDLFVDGLVKFWVSEGAAKEKLVIGMPFYGRTFQLADPNVDTIGALHTGGDFTPYYDICATVKDLHLHERILETERVPYIVYNGTWTGYDNMQSLREKAEYVHKNGYGGVMVWSIDMDDNTGGCGHGQFPLMHALISGLKGHGTGVVG